MNRRTFLRGLVASLGVCCLVPDKPSAKIYVRIPYNSNVGYGSTPTAHHDFISPGTIWRIINPDKHMAYVWNGKEWLSL